MLGDIAPFAKVGLAQAVADHHVEFVILRQPSNDVGPDEAGPARDKYNLSGHLAASLCVTRAMAADVE